MFLGGQIGANPHVEHDDFPLRIAIGAGGADVVAMPRVLPPYFSAALLGRLNRCNRETPPNLRKPRPFLAAFTAGLSKFSKAFRKKSEAGLFRLGLSFD